MKRLLSFCLALSVCLSLLIGFSATVNAEAFTDFEVRQEGFILDLNDNIIFEDYLLFRPNNGTQESHESVHIDSDLNIKNKQYYYHSVWNLYAVNGYPFSLGRVNTIKFENFYYRLFLECKSFGNRYVSEYDELYAIVTYADNSTERYELNGTLDADKSLDMSFSFTPNKNVYNITLHAKTNFYIYFNAMSGNTDSKIHTYFGEVKGDDKHQFNIDIQSEEAGLLSGLLGWVKNIFNSIGEIAQSIIDLPQKIWNFIKQGFDALGEALTNVWNTLIELPEKLWNLISDGLQYLFVPSDEDVDSFLTISMEMLETGLGAVWEVANMTYEAWTDILDSDETNSIEFPLMEISLPDDNTFSFGGYTVKVVPDGFENIVVVLKTLVGIVCTLSFINALKKRYEEMMA